MHGNLSPFHCTSSALRLCNIRETSIQSQAGCSLGRWSLISGCAGLLNKATVLSPNTSSLTHQPVVQQNKLELSNYTVFSRLEQDNMSKRLLSGTYRSLKHLKSKTKVSTYSGPVFRISADLWHPTRSCEEKSWTTDPTSECTLERGTRRHCWNSQSAPGVVTITLLVCPESPLGEALGFSTRLHCSALRLFFFPLFPPELKHVHLGVLNTTTKCFRLQEDFALLQENSLHPSFPIRCWNTSLPTQWERGSFTHHTLFLWLIPAYFIEPGCVQLGLARDGVSVFCLHRS